MKRLTTRTAFELMASLNTWLAVIGGRLTSPLEEHEAPAIGLVRDNNGEIIGFHVAVATRKNEVSAFVRVYCSMLPCKSDGENWKGNSSITVGETYALSSLATITWFVFDGYRAPVFNMMKNDMILGGTK